MLIFIAILIEWDEVVKIPMTCHQALPAKRKAVVIPRRGGGVCLATIAEEGVGVIQIIFCIVTIHPHVIWVVVVLLLIMLFIWVVLIIILDIICMVVVIKNANNIIFVLMTKGEVTTIQVTRIDQLHRWWGDTHCSRHDITKRWGEEVRASMWGDVTGGGGEVVEVDDCGRGGEHGEW